MTTPLCENCGKRPATYKDGSEWTSRWCWRCYVEARVKKLRAGLRPWNRELARLAQLEEEG